jgi:hypothetical protein
MKMTTHLQQFHPGLEAAVATLSKSDRRKMRKAFFARPKEERKERRENGAFFVAQERKPVS